MDWTAMERVINTWGGWGALALILVYCARRCFAEEKGLVSVYVRNNEALVSTAREQAHETSDTLREISASQQKVVETCQQIGRQQAGLREQHEAVRVKMDGLVDQHNNPASPFATRHLTEAAVELCDQLKVVARKSGIDCDNEMNAVKAKLTR